ncbi:PAP2 superfamily protein [Duganella sp. CF458]|uniref:phosphatase PAP2 family protein n=1 Tax=Duganella sp. CF458 TaxID=1884368 RepID=UPI0008F09266|nr:phosphatase PAP2 family protein [Duganella sp. CF458]SFF92797.1 PAP2 superfamily protein [Duganella sp. CF458]
MSAVLSPTLATRQNLPRALVHEHRLLLAIVGVELAAALMLCWAFPHKYRSNLQLEGYFATLALGLVFALCGYTIYVMVCQRPARLLHHLRVELTAYLTRERLLFAAPVLAMMPLFSASFTVIKAAVPLVQPYAWDARMAAADAWLHGGSQPWQLLQHVLGHPYLTAIINLNYHLWFFIMLSMVYWLAFNLERRQLRMQFMLSFVLSWILLGNVMAMLFSSVGPCYYGHVVPGADPFAGLMTYLHNANEVIPVWALDVQNMLWRDHAADSTNNALSIAAMPSMHVASSVLLALLGWRLNRAAGAALSVFALLVLLGSIHLGWHYAIDGYAGALGAWIIWTLCGKLPQRSAA